MLETAERHEPQQKTRLGEVMIVGPGPSKAECPYDCEVWTPDCGWNYAPRIDKVFCMGKWSSTGELKALKRLMGFSVVAAQPVDGIDVEPYPIVEVIERYAPLISASTSAEPYRVGFFANDIAYMIAYAVIKDYAKLRLYGIDILNSESFISEKGSMEYWLGVALGVGMQIWNAKGSVVARTHNGRLYGNWGEKTERIRAIVRDFNI